MILSTSRQLPLYRRSQISRCVCCSSKVDLLVVGGGGREHALCWKLRQSSLCKTLYCSPGNAGILQEPGILQASFQNPNNHQEVLEFCKLKKTDLVVIGPEAPLVSGLADDLESEGILVFGPSKAAAKLEGSKAFMKDLCSRYGIPTGSYQVFSDPVLAKEYIEEKGGPIVVKANGLAAGKGVIVCKNKTTALKAVEDLLIHRCFGDSIVVEEYLEGEEASFFALVNGEDVLPLTSAQDHKAVGEGDVGENTGGMGAYSPASVLTSDLEAKIVSEIIQPTASAMVQEGCAFKGVLFAGLMIINQTVKLLEYNVRFGDPECQCLVMRMKSDLLDLILKTCRGEVSKEKVEWLDSWAMTVVVASKGYPGSYSKGSVIRDVEKVKDAKVFHAGTSLNKDKELINIGGRVLGITSIGTTIEETQNRAYKAVDDINWKGGFCRRDIGWRALKRQSDNDVVHRITL